MNESDLYRQMNEQLKTLQLAKALSKHEAWLLDLFEEARAEKPKGSSRARSLALGLAGMPQPQLGELQSLLAAAAGQGTVRPDFETFKLLLCRKSQLGTAILNLLDDRR